MRYRIVSVFLLLLMSATAVAPAAAQDTPTAIVERLNETLLGVMREAESLGVEGRYQQLEPVLTDIFAFPTMARVSVGRHWRELSSEQRERLADAFSRFSVATYASRFNGFSGERFEIESEEAAARGSMLVHSKIITGDGETIPLDYLLRQRSGTWRIVDVYMEGAISELATRRSQYTSILDSQGYDTLMTLLEQRIADLRSESG